MYKHVFDALSQIISKEGAAGAFAGVHSKVSHSVEAALRTLQQRERERLQHVPWRLIHVGR